MPDTYTFLINPIERFSGSAIKRPTEIAHFSYTSRDLLPSGAPSASNTLHGINPPSPSPAAPASPTASHSHSSLRVLHHDARGLKYYYGPEIGASLSEGYETFQQLPDGDDEHLDGLLASVAHLEHGRQTNRIKVGLVGLDEQVVDEAMDKDMNGGSRNGNVEQVEGEWKIQPDIITWRGMITKVCVLRPAKQESRILKKVC